MQLTINSAIKFVKEYATLIRTSRQFDRNMLEIQATSRD